MVLKSIEHPNISIRYWATIFNTWNENHCAWNTPHCCHLTDYNVFFSLISCHHTLVQGRRCWYKHTPLHGESVPFHCSICNGIMRLHHLLSLYLWWDHEATSSTYPSHTCHCCRLLQMLSDTKLLTLYYTVHIHTNSCCWLYILACVSNLDRGW